MTSTVPEVKKAEVDAFCSVYIGTATIHLESAQFIQKKIEGLDDSCAFFIQYFLITVLPLV